MELRISRAIQDREIVPGRPFVIDTVAEPETVGLLTADFARRLTAVRPGPYLLTVHREQMPTPDGVTVSSVPDLAGRRFEPLTAEDFLRDTPLPLPVAEINRIEVRALPIPLGEALAPDFDLFQNLEAAGSLGFGHPEKGMLRTDAMVIAASDATGKWSNAEVMPSSEIAVSPNMQALHYGGAIFEGMSAEWGDDGQCYIFGMDEHYERMCRGAVHLGLKVPPKDLFTDAVIKAVQQNARFIPKEDKGRLYIRPHMADMGPLMRVGNSGQTVFMVEVTPVGSVGAYFGAENRAEGQDTPMKILAVPTNRIRAGEGQGIYKAAGNYGPTAPIIAAVKAVNVADDGKPALNPGGVLFLDRHVEGLDVDSPDLLRARICETNASNIVFFVDLGEGRFKVVTPSLEKGDILPGNTRALILEKAQEMGWEVEERHVTVGDLQKGEFCAAANCGTAATMSTVDALEFVHIEEDASGVTAAARNIPIPIRTQDQVNQDPTPECVRIILRKLIDVKTGRSGDADRARYLTAVPGIARQVA